MARYLKNERFGFSVTYYEASRPRQYYPDFIVAVREKDGREVMWIAETKGEIRPNTAVKKQAAEMWCEKMSATAHGPWRHQLLQQRKLETALASGVKTFSDLIRAMTGAVPERQFTLINLEDIRVKKEAFKTLLPLYSLKAAAGYFGKGEAVEPEGWIAVPDIGRLNDKMFVARAIGRSMEPIIHDGDLCVFVANPAGSRHGKIVLVQYRGPADPETGGAFTVKRYRSKKMEAGGEEWRHSRITLSPINPDFKPIVLTPKSEGDVVVIAEWLAALR